MEPSARNPHLNLPPVRLRVRQCPDGVWRVFDPLRDKFVALTPEEWVRQHFVGYLTGKLGYPPSLMANEVGLEFNGTRRRCDTVLFSRGDVRPVLIVEYKAPEVEITQKVFDQIARYNLVMEAPVLIVSNGMRHFCCLRDNASPEISSYRFLREIPDYQSLLQLLSRQSCRQ